MKRQSNWKFFKYIYAAAALSGAGMIAVSLMGSPLTVTASELGTEVRTPYLLAMQALTGQVLLPEEQMQISTWQTGAGDDGASAVQKAADQETGVQKIADQEAVERETTSTETGERIMLNLDDPDNEYADLAIAHVSNYVNIRSLPSTDGEVLGKIYNGSVAQILGIAGEDSDWFHVRSGSVDGYIKAEFFIYGDDAANVVDKYVTRYAVVKADRLNVRESADLSAKRIGYLNQGEKAKLVEDEGEWLQISYAGDKKGYVSAEYVRITEEFTYAKSIEEEKKELEAQKALQKRRETPETKAPENTQIVAPVTTYSTNSELRSQIVEYAMQFLGNRYVMGGNSLTNGTDCSGFTSLIYADFGYSISRTPSGQLSSAGRSISYSEIQPGDIVCYGKGSCSHVALYIGDGQIIHSANSRKGVVIYNADYDNILGVKNVID